MTTHATDGACCVSSSVEDTDQIIRRDEHRDLLHLLLQTLQESGLFAVQCDRETRSAKVQAPAYGQGGLVSSLVGVERVVLVPTGRGSTEKRQIPPADDPHRFMCTLDPQTVW